MTALQPTKVINDLSILTIGEKRLPRKECQDKIKKLYDYRITLPVIRVSVKPFKENSRKEVFRRVIEALKI